MTAMYFGNGPPGWVEQYVYNQDCSNPNIFYPPSPNWSPPVSTGPGLADTATCTSPQPSVKYSLSLKVLNPENKDFTVHVLRDVTAHAFDTQESLRKEILGQVSDNTVSASSKFPLGYFYKS